MKAIFISLLFLALSSCVTTARQTEALLKNKPTNIADTKEIKNVPFVNQSAGQCGPATLTMAMNWAGHMISVEELSPQVFTPGMKGSLQSDMISASRRNGLMAVPIEGLNFLLSEVDAGHPVIVFENLAVTWLPQWHYAIVFGYDLNKEEVLMHSGPEQNKRWDMAKFERSWMLGDYWGLVVVPAGEIAVTASELANATAAAGLEQAGQKEAAERSYVAIVKRWPNSLTSLVGLANLSFEKNNSLDAVKYLKQAAYYFPNSSIVWHNLAIAEGHAKMKKDAQKSAQQALKLANAADKEKYSQSLKAWL
ncbi:MAG: PA2778 family cysteine peptidase [Bdellovibrio sp.]|nr:PA2778 family cysteine peptidase [Bdellovibrio sp.]